LDEDRRTTAESRADGFLSKPLREDHLLGRWANMASRRSSTKSKSRRRSISGLRFATTQNGNKKSLDGLIQPVSDSPDTGCAHALWNLADKYEYDALTRLLDAAGRR
jgi:hypothetical protein